MWCRQGEGVAGWPQARGGQATFTEGGLLLELYAYRSPNAGAFDSRLTALVGLAGTLLPGAFPPLDWLPRRI